MYFSIHKKTRFLECHYTEQLQKASSSYGWKSMKLDVSSMPTGLYIAHLEAGNRSDSFSFVVVQ